MQRHVAVKLMDPEHVAHARTVECLHRGAMAVNIIPRPSVVQVYEFGHRQAARR